jgi:hypothetical protein
MEIAANARNSHADDPVGNIQSSPLHTFHTLYSAHKPSLAREAGLSRHHLCIPSFSECRAVRQ